MRRAIMKKAFILLVVTVVIGFALVSCVKEVVSYCVFCGHAGIEEESEYDKTTGKTMIYYKCTYSECGKSFGAGQIPH
jgi:hypothetical protein